MKTSILELFITRVSLFLYKWLEIDCLFEDEKIVYEHSIKLIIYDLIQLTIVLVLGFYTKSLKSSILFVILFNRIRRYSGGYHAETHFKCLVSFIGLYLLFLILYYYIDINKILSNFIVIISSVYIAINSPVEHRNQRLSNTETKKNKLKTIIILVIYVFAYTVSTIYKLKLNKVIVITLLYTTILMAILKMQSKWETL